MTVNIGRSAGAAQSCDRNDHEPSPEFSIAQPWFGMPACQERRLLVTSKELVPSESTSSNVLASGVGNVSVPIWMPFAALLHVDFSSNGMRNR